MIKILHIEKERLPMDDSKFQDRFHILLELPKHDRIQVVFKSISKYQMSFEIIDKNKIGRGVKTQDFTSSFIKTLTKTLLDDLNPLFKEFCIHLTEDDIFSVIEEICQKCESLCGDGAKEGDSIIIFH